MVLRRMRRRWCFRVWVQEKRGREPVSVGSLPLSFLLCGADDGSRTRCLHLGRVALFLVSYICICVPRLFERCQLACLCVAGFGADDGA